MLPSSRIANHLTLRPRDRVEIVYSGRILVQDTSSRTRSISSRSFFFRLRTRVLESGLLSCEHVNAEAGGRRQVSLSSVEGGRRPTWWWHDDWLDHRIIGRTLLVIRHTVIRTIMSVYVRLLLCACLSLLLTYDPPVSLYLSFQQRYCPSRTHARTGTNHHHIIIHR